MHATTALLAVVLLAVLPSPAIPAELPIENPFNICNTSMAGTYEPNSTYLDNLRRLSATLPAAAAASATLFATAAAGTGLDRAFALALCRGDMANAKYCFSCVSNAFSNSLLQCAARDATFYYDNCYLRFSPDQSFLSSDASNAPERVLPNLNNVTASSAGRFDGLVARLVNATADLAASSARRFATGEAEFDEGQFPKLYAVAQCTPDMAAARCRGCLGGLTGEMPAWFIGGRLGGRILGVRCNVRYEVYTFFSGDAMVQISDIASRASKIKLYWIIATVVSLTVLFICLLIWVLWMKRRKRTGERNLQEQTMSREEVLRIWRIEESGSEFSLFEFSQLAEATNNFSAANILGEGGFGRVYKGQLPDGIEIAVKRLGACSRQGLLEFKNEIQLIAKLQHTNLVKLLGCCIQGDEKMLIYEYMINKSLDFFIFDKVRRELLNWNRRFRIIEGIAEGLLYLHKHSRLRIIHRDLKTSNILLDNEMNPKISDFGMAKIFGSNVTEGNTNRVVGTYGYMAPEYASKGLFSIKSDVFSFGVLLLEIISGQRNSAFHKHGNFLNLFGYAWQLWGEDRWFELIDPALGGDYQAAEIMRCTQVALLCVQENAADRPTISEAIMMLSNERMSLPEPKQPAYFNTSVPGEETSCTTVGPCSVNDVTISTVDPR